jgi:ankyrin repeat protein
MKQSLATILKQGAVLLALGTWALSSAPSRQPTSKVDFRRDVQPLFKQYCIECHGPSQQMHGLRLDRRGDAMRGGTIKVIAPGNSAGSRLYLKLIGSRYGPQMPPTGPLSPEEIDVFKAWIDQGAEWPDDLAGDAPAQNPDPKAAPILEALRNGDKHTFKKLAAENPKAGNLRGPGGTTPLMQAALYGDSDSVRFLLENGADPNIRNEAGATALMWAVDDLEKTRLLLDHGADVNAHSDDGRTPLLIAAGQFGTGAMVRLLVDRGADPSAKSPTVIGYMTPLAEAASVGDDALMRMLIDRGVAVKAAGVAPLRYAVMSRCRKCLEMLIERAAPDSLNIAALRSAPPAGDGRAVKALLDRGADANASDQQGHSLLMLVAGSDAIATEAVKSLIERGADINLKSPEGRTALDFAKLRGATAVVDMLVKAGAREGTAPPSAIPTPRTAGSVHAALARSIPLLQKADAIFLHQSGCVSCHNNLITAMTVATARNHGVAVDDVMARSQLKAIGSFIESRRERALQGSAFLGGESASASYNLLGLAAENYSPDAATDAIARYLESRQQPDGRWQVTSHRPPIESSDIQVTAASIRSLQVYAPRPQRSKYEAAVRRAANWLMRAQPQTTEDRAFQLLGLGWAGVKSSSEVTRRAVRGLLGQQRSDGGWAQLPTLGSDSYATGQALVALNQAGALPVTDLAYRRGVEFLLKTQLEDGSWYVRSRAIPAQPYFEGGFPHGRDQFISAAATNWASMALTLTCR